MSFISAAGAGESNPSFLQRPIAASICNASVLVSYSLPGMNIWVWFKRYNWRGKSQLQVTCHNITDHVTLTVSVTDSWQFSRDVMIEILSSLSESRGRRTTSCQWERPANIRLLGEKTMERILLVILTLECLPLSSNQEEIKTNIVKLPPVRWT